MNKILKFYPSVTSFSILVDKMLVNFVILIQNFSSTVSNMIEYDWKLLRSANTKCKSGVDRQREKQPGLEMVKLLLTMEAVGNVNDHG